MNKAIFQTGICKLFGHRIDDSYAISHSRQCRCGSRILPEDRSETRIRHVVSCFLLGHSYIKAAERHGHSEFLCRPCGHPLLIEAKSTLREQSFTKRPRYICNLFGHKVHRIVERNGFTEYACGCGHSFLKSQNDLVEIKHPITCLIAGHFVRFLTRREGYTEYACRNCGHTFYFPALIESHPAIHQ